MANKRKTPPNTTTQKNKKIKPIVLPDLINSDNKKKIYKNKKIQKGKIKIVDDSEKNISKKKAVEKEGFDIDDEIVENARAYRVGGDSSPCFTENDIIQDYKTNKEDQLLTADKLKIQEIKKKIQDKELSQVQIINANLPEKDKEWFIENLEVLRKLPRDSAEERYRLKYKIYERFEELKQLNMSDIETENKLENIGNIGKSLKIRILKSGLSDYKKAILLQKYSRLKNLEHGDEYYKAVEWIDTVLGIPDCMKDISTSKLNISERLVKLKKTLDKNIYGLDNAKEKIMETFCKILTNPETTRRIIAFVGPPGVGKTVLASSIAEAINLPFDQISLGGMKDASFLTGHSSTYIGARPGVFITILRRMGYLNGVLFIDEFDKIPNTAEGQGVHSTLLHVLDSTQNNRFQDVYMPEIPIDLSHLFFVIAMNDDMLLDPILKDRLNIIRIDGYKFEDKVKIGLNYMVPKITSQLKMTPNEVIITPSIMEYIVKKSKIKEDGVRQLERNLNNMFERINVLKCFGQHSEKQQLSYKMKLSLPVTLTKKHVDILFQEQ